MNTNSFFNPDEAFEHGQSLIKKQVQVTAKVVAGQIAGQKAQSPADPDQAQAAQDKSTNEFLDEMYAPSTNDSQQPQQAAHHSQSFGGAILSQIKGQSPVDQEKMAQIRRELKNQHKTSYYEPLVTRPKEEERSAEKLEREENEEKQKRWELQQKEAEKAPIAVTQAQNKAEMFRGAAG